MILEVDPTVIAARVSMRDAQAETPLAEQSLSQVGPLSIRLSLAVYSNLELYYYMSYARHCSLLLLLVAAAKLWSR